MEIKENEQRSLSPVEKQNTSRVSVNTGRSDRLTLKPVEQRSEAAPHTKANAVNGTLNVSEQ